MIEFKNDAEIWMFLINGGTVVEKSVGENKKKIRLVAGKKTYLDGASANNCLLSYDYWVGIDL
jgi:hypothetical protein